MEVDSFEDEIEYERLMAALTCQAAENFIRDRHASQRTWDGAPLLTHLYAVSKLAEDYADLYFRDEDFYGHAYHKLVCRLGGMLHESMDWGATFEELTDVSDESVARAVAALTADRRLPRPKRLQILVNQVGLAMPTTHIIKMADLLHDTVRLNEAFRRRPTIELARLTELWIEESREVFHVMDKIKESAYLSQPVVNLKTSIAELDKKCRQLRRCS